MPMDQPGNERRKLLHDVARVYVTRGLGGKDFDAIPYEEQVSLRAPLCPGGSSVPLVGRSNLRSVWWAPLPDLIAGVDLLDSYVNESLTGVTVEFHCHLANPACTLRICDRFIVNADGRITEQENYFDPRDVTNPGWRDA